MYVNIDYRERGDDNAFCVVESCCCAVIGGEGMSLASSRSSAVREGLSSVVREGPSSAEREGPSSVVREGPSLVMREGPSSVVMGLNPATSSFMTGVDELPSIVASSIGLDMLLQMSITAKGMNRDGTWILFLMTLTLSNVVGEGALGSHIYLPYHITLKYIK